MTASNSELIPLIYRHLKEQGFHTAADELQKQVTQNEAPSTSTTLLDIYTAWLKSSKRRKKPATSKPSAPDQKQTTPKKAAQRKKTDKTTKPGSKSGSSNKKSTPAKRSKSDGKTGKGKLVKSNKPDTLKEEAAGGEDSDSDSSLDVEKWKKLVHEMTDTDLDKVAAFNALATPEPKKTRVRKPRTKPKPKNETPINGPGSQGEKSDQSTKNVLAKSNATKKSRAKKVVPVAALDKDQNKETPAASVISTSKQSPKKEKRKALDQASLEPKQKKKKQAIQNKVSTNATDGDNVIDKNINNNNKDADIVCLIEESQMNTLNLQTEPKKTKKKQTNQKSVDGLVDKNMNNEAKMVSQIELKENTSNHQTEPAEADSVVKGQKKKKKKDKADDDVDGDSQRAVVDTNTNPVIKKRKKRANEEMTDSNVLDKNTATIITGEDLNVNLPAVDITSSLNAAHAEADSVVKVKKKKKKKDKADDDGDSQRAVIDANTNSVINEGACEKTVEEAGPNTEVSKKKKKKKDKHKEESEKPQQMETNVSDEAFCVENTEPIVVKKKSKKKKQNEEHLGSEETPTTEGCEVPEEPPDPPSTPQTPGSKKKKHKLDSELIIADAVSTELDGETHKKKKKKSSKSKETEC